MFGDDAWESELAQHKGDDPRAIAEAYKKRLRALPGVKYVFTFEMCKQNTSIDYHLVFASQHPLGLEKMKEAMKRLDGAGTYRFCSNRVGQQSLFEFGDPRLAADQMHLRFAGQTISYAHSRDYALTESPFINPKAMLKLLESQRRITVHTSGDDRTKGTFPERLHPKISIQFL